MTATKLSKKPYKGTRDFFPTEKRVQDYLFSKMHQVARLHGFEAYDGPLLEEVELYRAKSGEELINDQIYSFIDRGERHVAIRPEMTPTLARMVAQVYREAPLPLRWYAIPNLMRYENPQKGRLREHWQFNCDIFGQAENRGECEILQIAIDLFKSFGANSSHFEILLNHRQVVEEVFYKVMGVNKESAHRLYKIVDKCKKVDESALKSMVNALQLPVPAQNAFYQYLNLSTFADLEKFLKNYQLEESLQNFRQLLDLTHQLQMQEYIKYDPTIVRGLDYYTGLVFEIFDKSPENRRALCGGGAYSNLLQIFDEDPLPGVGFGLGDVTLKDFLTQHQLLPALHPELDLFLTFQIAPEEDKAFGISSQLAQKLRAQQISCSIHPSSIKLKKVFPLAEKKGARFVTLIGEEEMQGQKLQLKNLATKEQITLQLHDVEQMVAFMKR